LTALLGDTGQPNFGHAVHSDRLLSPHPPEPNPDSELDPPAVLDSPGNFAHSCECPSGLLRAICSFRRLSDSPKSPGWTTPFTEQPLETSQLGNLCTSSQPACCGKRELG